MKVPGADSFVGGGSVYEPIWLIGIVAQDPISLIFFACVCIGESSWGFVLFFDFLCVG